MDINELIIKEVKKYEALYNTESEDYNEIRLKDEMWKLVAKKVGKSIDVVKEIWRDLRDTYKIYKNNEDMPSGSSQTNSSSFRYAESLSFLDKYLNTQASKHRSDNKHSTSKKRKSEEASHSLPVTNNINKSNDSNNHNTHMSTAKRSREDLSVSDISNVNNSGHDSNHNTRKPPEKFITKHSQDFIIEIIEILKNETAIWQTDSEKYNDPNEKEKSWERLLAKYKEFDENATTEKVKKKYNDIRESYINELEKFEESKKSGAGSKDIFVPTLWFDHLNFLRMSKMGNSFEAEIAKKPSVSSTVVKKSNLMPNKDEADIYGESWAVTYRKLESDQKIFARHLINVTLVFAELGKLTTANVHTILQYITNSTPIQHHAPTHESFIHRRSGSASHGHSPNQNWHRYNH